MTRQNLILFVVIGIFAALVAARAFVGDGMGRMIRSGLLTSSNGLNL
mgnify:CR=1 FL=1